MSSQKALEAIQNYYPGATIVELPGNPNIIGHFAFRVDDNLVTISNEGLYEEDEIVHDPTI